MAVSINRFIELFSLGSPQYLEGAPAVVSSGCLLMNRYTEKTIVKLSIKNVSDNRIISASVRIQPYDAKGKPYPETVELRYDALQLERGMETGLSRSARMPDDLVRSFSVCITDVTFADYTLWRETRDFSPVSGCKTLEEALGSEAMAKQYSARYGADCRYLPSDAGPLWYCTCGAVNHADEDRCYNCRRKRTALRNVNLDSLKIESEERAKLEKAQNEAQEQERHAQNARKRRIIKIALWVLPFLVAAAIILAAVPPFIERRNNYESAGELLSSNSFDEAQSAYEALGDYMDSAEKAASEVPYQRALYVMDCASRKSTAALDVLGIKKSEIDESVDFGIFLYVRAGELFQQLGGYKESNAKIQEINSIIEAYNAQLVQDAYDSAVSLLEERKFLSARDAFLAMGDYLDSPSMVQECIYRRAQGMLDFCESNNVRKIFLSVSDSADKNSVISMPGSVLTNLGSNAVLELKDCFQADGVDVSFENAPSVSGLVPICDAVAAEFEKLGDYKDSRSLKSRAIKAGDFTSEFYTLLSSGELKKAQSWLNTYDDDIPGRDRYPELFELYEPFCGYWEVYQGDTTLIPFSVGIEMTTLSAFTTKVSIEGETAVLHIYDLEGFYNVDLTADLGAVDFKRTPDEWSFYYAVLNNAGRFSYLRYYNSGGLASSCEYALG